MVGLPQNYCVDSTEVTREQYYAWLSTSPSLIQDAYCQWNTSFQPLAYGKPGANRPVVYVDWCDAKAYCKAVGKRLCGKIGGGASSASDHDDASKSQWFNACSSGGIHAYPYGDGYQPQTCNGGNNLVTGCWDGSCDAISVGSLPGCQASGAYAGIYDLSGNVDEWEDSCTSASCSVRGDSYHDTGNQACNDYWFPTRDAQTDFIGFRCCADL